METGSNEPKSRYLQYLEMVTGPLEDKRRYRQYKARIKQLPQNYRTAAEALERYLLLLGPADGAAAMAMYEDLTDLFERSAADGTPIRDIFGEDPVEFVEAFVANYPVGQWRSRERNRFTSAVARAAGEDPAREDKTER
ncbi:DNA-binding ferritin-like protein (Dps family) [Streptosporangium becharense]|uniref:DNA-binding ferritin-like protein (Dps family) n=1 Tax=Streptosporangium becharense TaxID=1816182 RepID=A0A7W9INK3_9ACTN|nr:DUF1048 domain-containing protein [Streptosporangium becharense]MBB2914342.1 DNA-binding ferritin-like protein (Dps family) [Streptosporangium becharense]MBB5823626.1 DNA-binding ferritin-like protein (Dps family) [Streptosporangium becharense]